MVACVVRRVGEFDQAAPVEIQFDGGGRCSVFESRVLRGSGAVLLQTRPASCNTFVLLAARIILF